MRKSGSQRFKVFAVLALSSLLISGCGLGTIVPHTQSMKPAGNGALLQVGELQLSGLIAVSDADGTVLSGAIVNRGESDDQVVAILIDGEQATLTPAELAAPADSLVKFGYQSEQVVAVRTSHKVGASVQVDLLFASGTEIRGAVLVVRPEGAYAGIDPQPVASLSATE